MRGSGLGFWLGFVFLCICRRLGAWRIGHTNEAILCTSCLQGKVRNIFEPRCAIDTGATPEYQAIDSLDAKQTRDYA
jgi:hypothetical protein